jgi:single-stranded-DNA-specific exonuclease
MAAGLRVSLDNLNALTFALTRELSTRVSLDVLQRDLPIDLVLDLNQVQDPLAELDLIFTQLTQLEPFGHGHPQPVIALLNFRPSRFNPGLSRDGKHLQFKIGSRKLWFWGEGSQHKDLEAAKGLDIAFVMEPSSWGSDPWQGKVKDVRAAGEWQLTAAAAVTLQIEDQRQSPSVTLTGAVFDGKIPPQPSSHLLLKRWPYLPEELQDLLDTVKPHTLVLASQAEDFSQVNLAIAHLVQAWEAGSRDPHQLAASGLPLRVIQMVLKLDLDSVPIGSAVVKLMQEVQAFQRWLDEAEPGEILKLCKRLMQAG